MDIYVVIGVLVIWMIYGIGIKLTKKRKYDYSFIVAFVFLLGFGYFYLSNGFESIYYLIYSYATIGLFTFWLVIDNLVLLFKKNVSEFDFHSLERELEHVSVASELLRLRFISTIELVSDGISFHDDGMIFGTDTYIDLVGFENNEFSTKEFYERVHKDDLVQYKMKLEKLSKKSPLYSIDYRIKKEGNYIWLKERGKAIFIDKKMHRISTVKPMDLKLFPSTDVDVLNHLPSPRKMIEEMQQLSRKKIAYHFVLIQLTNIPKINEKYGRDFGDLMMGEYLSKLRFKFIKDNKSLFRFSGIQFGLIIKDQNKFNLLDRALVGAGELLTLKMDFGGVSQVVYPNIGISESPYEGKNANVVLKEANQALQLTLNDKFGKAYCFYGRD
jgi:GGDEF domain-containing protein